MLFEKSCGGVVYRKHHGNIEVLLVKHINSGHWSFPKGHVEGEETEEQTARREIKEETGIDVMIDTSFRETVNFSPKKDTQKEILNSLSLEEHYKYYLNKNLEKKEIIKQIAKDRGTNKNEIYQYFIDN